MIEKNKKKDNVPQQGVLFADLEWSCTTAQETSSMDSMRFVLPPPQHHPNSPLHNPGSHHDDDHQADTGLVRPYGLAALGEPQGPGEAVEVDFDDDLNI